MKATLNLCGISYEVFLETAHYHSGNMAVQAVTNDGEPFAAISVNLPESSMLPKDAFYAKHWSENEGFIEQLITQKILIPISALSVSSGFISDIRAYTFAK